MFDVLQALSVRDVESGMWEVDEDGDRPRLVTVTTEKKISLLARAVVGSTRTIWAPIEQGHVTIRSLQPDTSPPFRICSATSAIEATVLPHVSVHRSSTPGVAVATLRRGLDCSLDPCKSPPMSISPRCPDQSSTQPFPADGRYDCRQTTPSCRHLLGDQTGGHDEPSYCTCMHTFFVEPGV
nr:hypothetical protein CFP56_11437 [Quercus suber]